MRRIAGGPARFISRADESGTHGRERLLWEAAKVRPPPDHLIIAGAGMGDTLRIASETASYTLTDAGTWDQWAPQLHPHVVSQGDPVLLNSYAVVVDPANESGLRFATWLADGAGRQEIIDLLQRRALRGFEIWPRNRPRATPTDRPY